jgi:hypothetical protein
MKYLGPTEEEFQYLISNQDKFNKAIDDTTKEHEKFNQYEIAEELHRLRECINISSNKMLDLMRLDKSLLTAFQLNLNTSNK